MVVENRIKREETPSSLPPSSPEQEQEKEKEKEGGREEAMCALWFDEDEDDKGDPKVVEVRREGAERGREVRNEY